MLVIQTFRADRLLAVASQFVVSVFGDVFQHDAGQELDLGKIVSTEVSRFNTVMCTYGDCTIISLTLSPVNKILTYFSPYQNSKTVAN